MSGYERIIADSMKGNGSIETFLEADFMTERDKEFIEKKYVQGKMNKEIATDLNLSTQQIYNIEKRVKSKVRAYIIQEWLEEQRIELSKLELLKCKGLSDRSRNALLRKGFKTFAEVRDYIIKSRKATSFEAILSIRNIGVKSAEEIITYMIENKILNEGRNKAA